MLVTNPWQDINDLFGRYFEDEKVLSRVPSLFLFLGFIFIAMEILALIAIRPPTEKEVEEILVSANQQIFNSIHFSLVLIG